MAFSNELVLGSTTFGLRALRGQQVTEARRAADQLSFGGNLEALGNGLFGLLHGRSGRKQSTGGVMASVLSDKVHAHDPAPNPDPRRLLRGRSARQARQPG